MLNSDLFGLSQELKIKKKKKEHRTPLSTIRQKKNTNQYISKKALQNTNLVNINIQSAQKVFGHLRHTWKRT